MVVSNRIPNIVPETIALTGIIGVYTVFVLGVGRFLRLGVAGLSHLAIYEDMPNVDKLLQHCKVLSLFSSRDLFDSQRMCYWRDRMETLN